MAGGIPNLGSLLDYLAANQGLSPAAAAASDVPAAAGTSGLLDSLSGLLSAGGAGTLGGLLGGLGGGLLSEAIGSLFGGGRASTGPGSATADIASAASNTDPVLALLGMGAGALSSGVPISSSSGAASGFGPYFDVARKLEDLVRWGPGGLNNPKISALDATTLKNALTELGNPGGNNLTIQALQNAWNAGQQNLTPQNLKLLERQLTPQQVQILKPLFSQSGEGDGGRGNWTNNPNNPINPWNIPTNPTNPNQPNNPLQPLNNPNYQLPANSIISMAQMAPLLSLLRGNRSGFSSGWTVA